MNDAQLQQDNWAAGLNDRQRKSLSLLGQGISPVMVASTLGVSESLISQYLAEERFASEVTKLKLAALQKQTGVDNKYLEAEEKMVDKLLKVIPLMTKPMDILRGIQVINATKRRGMSDAPVGGAVTNIVQINLPQQMAARFITGAAQQIVEVVDEHGPRNLITASAEVVRRLATKVDGDAEIAETTSWQVSATTENLLQQASERVHESRVSEVAPKGLRRSLEAKGQITVNDL